MPPPAPGDGAAGRALPDEVRALSARARRGQGEGGGSAAAAPAGAPARPRAWSEALALARRGALYPAVIVDGGEPPARTAAAIELARALLCERAAAARPCGACRHCRRIVWPAPESAFHPDFQVLERDLKTATSAAATRAFVKAAALTPFEARGQVFVVASAETLSAEAADALLKLLEEPPLSAPRHFLLLAPSRQDLPPTLRSRALAIYLGSAAPLAAAEVEALAAAFGAAAGRFLDHGAAVHLVAAAAALASAGQFDDPRAGSPWALAAAAVAASARRPDLPSAFRRRLLALAEALLAGPDLRLRAVPAERILEGFVTRYLALPGEPEPLV